MDHLLAGHTKSVSSPSVRALISCDNLTGQAAQVWVEINKAFELCPTGTEPCSCTSTIARLNELFAQYQVPNCYLTVDDMQVSVSEGLLVIFDGCLSSNTPTPSVPVTPEPLFPSPQPEVTPEETPEATSGPVATTNPSFPDPWTPSPTQESGPSPPNSDAQGLPLGPPSPQPNGSDSRRTSVVWFGALALCAVLQML